MQQDFKAIGKEDRQYEAGGIHAQHMWKRPTTSVSGKSKATPNSDKQNGGKRRVSRYGRKATSIEFAFSAYTRSYAGAVRNVEHANLLDVFISETHNRVC